MSEHIETTFDETDAPTDDGVERELTADETFDFHDERVERETTVALLEDGGVFITQATDQGTYDSLTLSERVADKLVDERDSE